MTSGIDMANEFGKGLSVAVQFIDSSFAKLIDDVTLDRAAPQIRQWKAHQQCPPLPIIALTADALKKTGNAVWRSA